MDTIKLKNGKTLNIIQDSHCENPRSWDNLSKMIFFNKKKSIGDKHDINFPFDFESRQYFIERGGEYVKKITNSSICLPVHYYEHGGCGISLSYEYPYNCRWDSCTIGFVIVTKEDIRKEYGVKRISQKILGRVMKVVEGETETLNQYISGEVYGFEVKNEDGKIEDSCWGFYGVDECFNEAKSIVEYYMKEELETV